ncbi:MAG: sigma-70 family RNA polymerase sigma factor [Ruminococcus sp.]|nr:sigma-70 family RNA polymerase sigma factor [Ruminococcus sp.]
MKELTYFPSEFGSDEYIKYVLDTYSDMLLKLCYTYTKSTADAEDLVSDVLMSLIKREIPFESAEHEKAWLLRLAINRSKNFVKSGWFRHRISLDLDENRAQAEEIPANETVENPVLEAVLSLPEKYRTPIHMFYYGGYSLKEIGKILGKKEATVGTLIARARKLLKDVMFDDEAAE